MERSKDRSGPPPETWLPLDLAEPRVSPSTRVLPRDPDAQVRLAWHPGIGMAGGLELRLFRKSPAEEPALDAYLPTAAGLVVPKEQLRELTGMLGEIIRELGLE
jgi:hypothetical protein